MLKNYIKIALKVFWRHKFFTAVNLLGICFTLVVLIAAVAFIDQQTGVADVAPEVHNDRTLYLKWLFVRSAITDTSGTVSQHSAIASGIAYRFLDRYVRPLETAENVAVFSDVDYRGLHGGAEEGHVEVKLTDGAFWEVFNFDFRQGRPYTAAEVEAGEVIAVISVWLQQAVLRLGRGRWQNRTDRRAALSRRRGRSRCPAFPAADQGRYLGATDYGSARKLASLPANRWWLPEFPSGRASAAAGGYGAHKGRICHRAGTGGT